MPLTLPDIEENLLWIEANPRAQTNYRQRFWSVLHRSEVHPVLADREGSTELLCSP
jgi:hypothetical protein